MKWGILLIWTLLLGLPKIIQAQYELQLSFGPTGISFLDDRPFRVSSTNGYRSTANGTTYDIVTWQTFVQNINISLEQKKRHIGVRLNTIEFLNDRSLLKPFQPWEVNKFVKEDYFYFGLQPYFYNQPYTWLRLNYMLGLSFRHGVSYFASDIFPRYHYIDRYYFANDYALNPGITAELLLPYNFTLALHQNYHYFFKMKDPNSPRHTYVANATLGYHIQFKKKQVPVNGE